MRKAIVTGGLSASLGNVQSYLPRNFAARLTTDGEIVIEGKDEAGWTLDGYVIPRLASGLIVAIETG